MLSTLNMSVSGSKLAYLVPVLGVAWYLSWLYRVSYRIAKRGLKLPPGPRRWVPWLGNANDLRKLEQHVLFAEWQKQYGDVIYLKIMGQDMLILNTKEAINDLLNKRSGNYGDRQPMPLLDKWGGYSFGMVPKNLGPEVNAGRRLIQHSTSNKALFNEYEKHMQRAALDLAEMIVRFPGKHSYLVARMVSSSILRIMYGYEVKEYKDPYVEMVQNVNDSFKDIFASLGTHPVDIFPVLASLPPDIWGKRFARSVRDCAKHTRDLFEKPWKMTRERMEKEGVPPSMASFLVGENKGNEGGFNGEKLIQGTLAEAYQAATDAPEMIMRIFLLAMMRNPEIQRTAQEYIDEVCQGERMPNGADRAGLPYVEAILKEVMRWMPITPLTIPHLSREEDEYKGWYIPAKTMVLPNTWLVLQNEEDFPNPTVFDPSRWVDIKGRLREDMPAEPREFVFGSGRRMCPGRSISEATLFINMVTLLFLFEIRKPVDPQTGEVLEQEIVMEEGGAMCYPKAFKCDFVPRSQQRMEMMHATMESLKF